MALYGKQLAKQVPDTVSGNQARVMFGAMTRSLANAYSTLANYDSLGIAQFTGLDAGSVEAARHYLDTTNAMIGGYYGNMFEDDAALTDLLLQQLRASVSASSVAVKTIDDLFGTPWLSELCDAIVEAAKTVSATIANNVSKVAGSFIGGTWWLWLLVLGGVILATRYKRAGKGAA